MVQMPAASVEGDQGAEQQVPDALASGVAVHVDGVLDDSGVYRPARHRRGGHPADDAGSVEHSGGEEAGRR
jgi:hypothetical protein